jgi:hypothetical protein
MPPSNRPARPGEASAVRDLVRAAHVARIGREAASMRDDDAARIAAGETWALEEAGALAGVLVLEEGL